LKFFNIQNLFFFTSKITYMKHLIFTFFSFFLCSMTLSGQVYLDQFDNGVQEFVTAGNGYATAEAGGEWTITGNGTSGQYTIFGYQPFDASGQKITLDVTGNNKVYVRAKVSKLGTTLRLDLKDKNGYATTVPGVKKTLVNEYVVFEYDFTGGYQDGGYGGTSCTAGPCPVDGTAISNFEFYINPGSGAFDGTLVIDFISVGKEPAVAPMSDVFQNQFDSLRTIEFMGNTPNMKNTIRNSTLVVSGDGTNGLYENVAMRLHNTTTWDTVDVSATKAKNKVYMRMRSAVPATIVRLDLQDINFMTTTAGSIQKLITSEWATYEYNFEGSYVDLAYGGTGCSVGPCPVDPERIFNMVIFVNPGQPAFLGEVEIDYISFGTALEIGTGAEDQLVYGDHFSETAAEFAGTSAAFEVSIANSNLSIVGKGVDAPYAAVAYRLNDRPANTATIVDVTGNNKMFIKAKSSVANTILRVDLVDSTGFVTTKASFSRIIGPDYTTIELNFASAYEDAGYGGTACATGPCPVDGKAIRTVLLYPNPEPGMFNGKIDIDYISFGAPLGDDIFKYKDQFDNNDRTKWADANGFTVAESGTELTITGDGTAGAYSAFLYNAHDQATGDPLLLDITSNNKVYVKVKSSVPNVPLRIDLVDDGGYASTSPGVVRTMTSEYSILEFDFEGAYMDGGYGGTSCTAGPCPVDGTVVGNFLVYIDPAVGGYKGTVTFDWFSTIDPLETVPTDGGPKGLDDYKDEYTDNLTSFTAPNGGLTLKGEDGLLKIVGDGTSGAYAPVIYEMHQGLDSVIVNAKSNDGKLFVRARTTNASLPLRIDIQDQKGYLTSLAGVSNTITPDFTVVEYNYTGKYSDGGYGGTPCTAGPCPVDGERIKYLQIYLAPGVGLFSGETHIDWISFGEALPVNVIDETIIDHATIYPNPTDGMTHIVAKMNVTGDVNIQVVDMMGRVVLQQNQSNINSGENSFTIDGSDLNTGYYFVKFHVNGKPAFVEKLMVK
jgi:hypothetical protein